MLLVVSLRNVRIRISLLVYWRNVIKPVYFLYDSNISSSLVFIPLLFSDGKGKRAGSYIAPVKPL